MFFKKLLKIGIISFLLPLNPVSVAASEQLQPVETQKQSSFVATFIAQNQSAEELLEQGLNRAEQGDYHGAIDKFTQALDLNPDYAEAYMVRAAYYFDLGQRKNAIADLEKAVQLICQQEVADECQIAQEMFRYIQTESQ